MREDKENNRVCRRTFAKSQGVCTSFPRLLLPTKRTRTVNNIYRNIYYRRIDVSRAPPGYSPGVAAAEVQRNTPRIKREMQSPRTRRTHPSTTNLPSSKTTMGADPHHFAQLSEWRMFPSTKQTDDSSKPPKADLSHIEGFGNGVQSAWKTSAARRHSCFLKRALSNVAFATISCAIRRRSWPPRALQRLAIGGFFIFSEKALLLNRLPSTSIPE